MNYGPAEFHEAGSEAVKAIRRGRVINTPLWLHGKHSAAILSMRDVDYTPPLHAIMAAVSNVTGVSCHHIMSASRQQRIFAARLVYYHLARTLTNKSFPQIGRACGGRDHTTVMHGCCVAPRRADLAPVIEAVTSALDRRMA